MASRHGPRYGSARPEERIQAPTRPTLGAGAGAYRSAVSADNSASSQPRRATESLRPQPQESSSISRTPSSSRIPQVQAASRRAPAPRQATTRPPLSHQDKPWSSGFSNGLGSCSRSASSSAIPTSSAPPTRQAEELKPRPVRNVLRRKSANLAQQTVKLRTQLGAAPSRETDSPASITRSLASPDSQLDRSLTESPAEIRIAMQIDLPTTTAQSVKIYPELDRYRDAKPGSGHGIEVPYPLSTHDLPPPTPLFSGTSSQPSAYSGSPSTRFSGSPGPGPYSRDTTPTTSISSHSPGLVAPLRLPAPRVRQNSPARHQQTSRPPVTRRRAGSVPNEVDSISADPHGLAAVREALNSSSSSSTVREGDRKKVLPAATTVAAAASGETASEKKKKRKNLEAAPPPSPPPRKSSTKFKDSPPKGSSRNAHESSPSKPAREPVRPIMASSAASRPTPPTMTRAHTATPAVTSPRGVPPARPSRDGTPDLQSQISLPIPVVQSNLSSSSLSERRQSLPLGPGSRIAPGILAHGSSHNRSATPSSQPDRSMQPQSKLPIGREPTPALPRLDTRRPSHSGSTASRTPSPNVSSFRTRFPLFGRRTKTAPEAVTQAADQKEKVVRKGPAAGTGHEGYGRIGMSHRRRSSSLARGVGGTVSSQESLEKSLSDDPFLLERMKPVVIAGGDVVQNHNVGADLGRTESNQSLPGGFSRTGSDVSLAPPQGDRTTLWPSPFPRNATSPSLGSRRPSDSSDSEALAMRSTLAFRRSMHKMRDSADAAMRIPKPIITRTQGVASPALTSIDTTVMTDDSAVEAPAGGAFRIIKGPAPSTAAAKKLTKRAKSPRRWNFFGRSTSQPAAATKSPEPSKPVVTVKAPPPKAAAFYTMDLSEQEDNDGGDARDGRWDANMLAVPSPQPQPPQQMPTARRPSIGRTTTNSEEQLKRGGVVEPLEYPERMSPEPQLAQWTETPLVATPEPLRLITEPAEPEPQPTTRRVGRPSRLPQVGRIPKVVNSRPEQTSPKSFSRPFNRISMQPMPRGEIKDTRSVAKGPSPVKSSTPEPVQPAPSTQTSEQASTAATAFDSRLRGSRELTTDLANMMTEFLAFSPRKNSQSTTCTATTTTSSCSSGIVSYADATAIVPAPNAPLAEDEIWGEYDDFFGDETLKAPPSAGSSLGTPFHLEQFTERLSKKAVEEPLESPTLKQPVRLPIIDAVATSPKRPSTVSQAEPEREKVPVASRIYSTDMTGPLNEAIETGLIPISSPFSVSEFVGGYGDASPKTSPTTKAPSAKSPVIKAAASSKPPTSLRRNSTPVSSSSPRRIPHQKRASDASGASSLLSDLDVSSPLSQVNLRVGSMTVSKWLTFGHVLFSPVRDELVPEAGGSSEESLKRHSILVIDGLGNDDWSFYAAETYPAATFYNLSPRAPLATSSSSGASGSFPLTPPNHHQIQYMSHLDKFPFGPESFTAVVYRFPAAAPESHFRNVIAESRRVLKPGGYIELSILDVDLNNMGNRSRRVVRRLKERIHAVKPDTCLGSTADLLLRLLGRRGFVEIKSCRVGVPVASRLPASSSSGASAGEGVGPSPLARGAGATRTRRKKDDRSLAEMMRDESPVADESITKMVAKVGRWWFSRCYEPGVGAGAAAGLGGSVWNDKLLLAECREWGTSLKLMVCHARVPDGRARVASI